MTCTYTYNHKASVYLVIPNFSLSNLPFICFQWFYVNYIHIHHLISPPHNPASRKRYHCPHLAGDLGLLTDLSKIIGPLETVPGPEARPDSTGNALSTTPFMPAQTYIIRLLKCDDCSGCFLSLLIHFPLRWQFSEQLLCFLFHCFLLFHIFLSVFISFSPCC